MHNIFLNFFMRVFLHLCCYVIKLHTSRSLAGALSKTAVEQRESTAPL